MNDALAVHQNLDFIRTDAEKVRRLYDLKPLVCKGRAVYRDFCAHSPRRVAERLFRCDVCKLFSRFSEKRAAGRR